MLTSLLKKKESTPYYLQFSTDPHAQARVHNVEHNHETERLEKMLAWMPGATHHADPLGLVGEAQLYGGTM